MMFSCRHDLGYCSVHGGGDMGGWLHDIHLTSVCDRQADFAHIGPSVISAHRYRDTTFYSVLMLDQHHFDVRATSATIITTKLLNGLNHGRGMHVI